jgi:hypothetical protein
MARSQPRPRLHSPDKELPLAIVGRPLPRPNIFLSRDKCPNLNFGQASLAAVPFWRHGRPARRTHPQFSVPCLWRPGRSFGRPLRGFLPLSSANIQTSAAHVLCSWACCLSLCSATIAARGLYGPRFVGCGAAASIRPTMSSMLQRHALTQGPGDHGETKWLSGRAAEQNDRVALHKPKIFVHYFPARRHGQFPHRAFIVAWPPNLVVR